MNQDYQLLKQQVKNLALSFDGESEAPIDKIVDTIKCLSAGKYAGFFENVRDEVKYHWKLFPFRPVRSQIKNIRRILYLAGDELNPNRDILKVLLKLFKKASPQERIEVEKALPIGTGLFHSK